MIVPNSLFFFFTQISGTIIANISNINDIKQLRNDNQC